MSATPPPARKGPWAPLRLPLEARGREAKEDADAAPERARPRTQLAHGWLVHALLPALLS